MGEPGALEDDGGKAKSVEDVGKDGLEDVSAISLMQKLRDSNTK